MCCMCEPLRPITKVAGLRMPVKRYETYNSSGESIFIYAVNGIRLSRSSETKI